VTESQHTPATLGERELRRLTSLADGTLPTWRRTRLQRRVARSPERRAELERQRQAVNALRGVDVHAPASLRARVESEHAGRSGQPRSRTSIVSRPVVVGGVAALAVVIAAILILPGGAREPTIGDADELATLSASTPAPEPRATEPALLAAAVVGVAFPNWGPQLDWRASGRRIDELDGRQAETVFYEHTGDRVGYTIVSGQALEWPPHGKVTTREGIELRSYRDDGRTVVTWLRRGHVCVLSGRGLERDTLLDLAAWNGEGAVVS
jgi:anti-sigma factor RsiW